MAPKTSAKTKAQELQRIRENQQRSRDRKRTYIAELEGNVRQLKERLRRCEPSATATSSSSAATAVENEARNELLKALGIDDAAQDQFVRAFAKRSAAGRFASDLQAAKVDGTVEKEFASTSDQYAPLSDGIAQTSSHPRSDNSVDGPPSFRQKGKTASGMPHASCCGTDPSSSYTSSAIAGEHHGLDEQTAESMIPAPQNTLVHPEAAAPTMDTRSLDQQTLFTPCLWNATVQSGTSCSESKTGCSVAFSMLLANNSRGYTFADLDARLQAAYLQDDSVAEGCSVLNKVLYQLLGQAFLPHFKTAGLQRVASLDLMDSDKLLKAAEILPLSQLKHAMAETDITEKLHRDGEMGTQAPASESSLFNEEGLGNRESHAVADESQPEKADREDGGDLKASTSNVRGPDTGELHARVSEAELEESHSEVPADVEALTSNMACFVLATNELRTPTELENAKCWTKNKPERQIVKVYKYFNENYDKDNLDCWQKFSRDLHVEVGATQEECKKAWCTRPPQL